MKNVFKVFVIILVGITFPIWIVPALFYLVSSEIVEYLGWFDEDYL